MRIELDRFGPQLLLRGDDTEFAVANGPEVSNLIFSVRAPVYFAFRQWVAIIVVLV
jgi:hypothetical protein